MPTKLVVVGGGFAGLLTAKKVKKCLGKAIDITIIDKKDYFLFSPRLIDALAGHTSSSSLKHSLSEWSQRHGTAFVQGEALSVDRSRRTLAYQSIDSVSQTSIDYDVLLLSPGARTNFQYLPQAETAALALKTEEDVERIHERLHELIAGSSPRSIVVIGGGPSGIEAVSALKTYAEGYCRTQCPERLASLSFILLQAAPQILPGFPMAVVQSTLQELVRQKITVIVGSPVVSIDSDHLTTASGQHIPAHLVIWAAGIRPNLIPLNPPLEEDFMRGIVVDHFLRAEPNVFAAGDVANYREQNVIIPKNAQTAMRMAKCLAQNVINTIQNRPLIPFRYRSQGNLLLLGETGIIDLKRSALTHSWVPRIRDFFYRFREWQILK